MKNFLFAILVAGQLAYGSFISGGGKQGDVASPLLAVTVDDVACFGNTEGNELVDCVGGGSFITEAEGDARYAQQSNNLSDLDNLGTARSNLSVYSQAELDGGQLDGQYFQESEYVTTSAGAGDVGKPIILDAAGHVDATAINDADIDHANIGSIGTNTHAQIDSHISSTANPHSVTAAQVSALPLAGGTMAGDINMGSNSLTAVNAITIDSGTQDYLIQNVGKFVQFVAQSVDQPAQITLFTGDTDDTETAQFQLDTGANRFTFGLNPTAAVISSEIPIELHTVSDNQIVLQTDDTADIRMGEALFIGSGQDYLAQVSGNNLHLIGQGVNKLANMVLFTGDTDDTETAQFQLDTGANQFTFSLTPTVAVISSAIPIGLRTSGDNQIVLQTDDTADIRMGEALFVGGSQDYLTQVSGSSLHFTGQGVDQDAQLTLLTGDTDDTETARIQLDTGVNRLNFEINPTAAVIGTAASATVPLEFVVDTDKVIEIDPTGSGQLAFFAATTVAQQANIGALTDSTGGTANATVAAVSGSGADATINDNFADLIAKVNALETLVENYGLTAP